MNTILIDLKGSDVFVNASNLVDLPKGPLFGNLVAKQYKIIDRLQRVNMLLKRLAKAWQTVRFKSAEPPLQMRELVKDNLYLQEEIIYHLKICCDEMIALCWYAGELSSSKMPPKEILVGSIGEYINTSNNASRAFDGHIEFLKTINDLANAYKHSFVQSDASRIGGDEPCFFALYTKRGKLHNTQELGCAVNNVIRQFNDFYSCYVDYLAK